MDTCICHDVIVNHSFATVEDAIYRDSEINVILAGSKLIAMSDEKWIRLYGCQNCSTLWAEACYTSGHMDIYYLFPVPETRDPFRWLRDEATELEPHQKTNF